MKITVAWNVWNNYLDTALGSEIFRLQNADKKIFDEVHLISQGGYPDPPSQEHTRYLDGHFAIAYPEGLPLLKVGQMSKAIFRLLEGIKHAFRYAQAHGHDFAAVTNADAWFLDLEKLHALFNTNGVQQAAISMRVGWVTGLELNFGNRVPLPDDHFMILNVAECARLRVFDYGHEAQFFRPRLEHFANLHYILTCFLHERVPKGALHIYTALADTTNQYGDFTGFNQLPWQYQPAFGFLHANAAQTPSLHQLRAAFLHNLGLTRYPLVEKYYKETAPDPRLFRRRRGVLVYKKPLKRALKEAMYWYPYLCYTALMRHKYARRYAALPEGRVEKKTLQYFDALHHVKPYWLTQ
ncbi:hypothetical protein HYW17_03960 [Candidatus Uhrbacteria bacterium]|nr:hypothetical protein [Candidatus Uhrbacteria bacterium]